MPAIRPCRLFALAALLAAAILSTKAAGPVTSVLAGSASASTTGLVAAYSFDEGTGSMVADASGNGNSGTIANATWAAGHAGKALSFNGTNSWVTIGDSPSLDLTSGMTLEAWVKPASMSGWRAVIEKEQPGELIYSLYGGSDRSSPVNDIYTGGAEHALYGSATLPLQSWTHLAATYDGSTLRLYVNGVSVASVAQSGSIVTSSGSLRIGGDSVWGEYFDGLIDDVRVYNRALSATEIQTDMNTPVGGSVTPPPPPPPPPPSGTSGLVAAYGFNAGSGTTTVDSSGNGNTGTISGATWTSAGKYGNGLSFNGSSSWVTVPDSASLDLSAGTTLEAWVDPSALGTTRRTVVGKEGSGELVYGLYANTGMSTSAGGLDLLSTSETLARGQTQLPLSSWTYLAATYDGKTITMYENGSPVATVADTGSITASSGVLRIGGNSIAGQYFQGVIDDVRIYNTALTQAQIQTDMNTPVGGTSSSPPPPPPPPPSDTTPPSTPTGLAAGNVTQTGASLSWNPSTDNVAVVGYGVYVNGSNIATAASTSYSVSGLSCGTSYTLAVDAVDASGNRSAKASVNVTTSACSSPGGGGATVFVSPSGSDSNPCTQSAPCRSFDRAYHVAQPGQTVQMAGGSYGSQTISSDSTKTSTADVSFQPAPGAAVTVDSLTVNGNHVSISSIKTTTWIASGTDITLQNLSAQTFLTNAHQLNVLGGDVGNYAPFCASGSQYPAMDNATVSPMNGQTPSDIVIKGVTFHDFSSKNCSASHMDCLQVAGAIRLTIANDKFYRCQVQDLILTGDFGVMDNITVEQNWFGPTDGGGESMDWNPTRDCPGAIVRYNTFVDTGVEFDCSRNYSGLYYGNIVPSLSDFDCGTKQAVQWDNVGEHGTATSACGPGSFVVPDGQVDMVNRAAGDYHLTANSEARGRGDSNNFPATDIDGDVRVAPIDAGADQYP